MKHLLATVFVALAAPAIASPPPVGSDDWNIMQPYAEWISTQHNSGGYWCCDWSDGRPVDARIAADGHWEAHVTPEHFPGAVDHWVKIDDGKVLHDNPVGVPILWFSVSGDRPYCFAPAGGV